MTGFPPRAVMAGVPTRAEAHRVSPGERRRPLRADERRGARGATGGGVAVGPRRGPGCLHPRSPRDPDGHSRLRRAPADDSDQPAPLELDAAGPGLPRGSLAELRGVAGDLRAPGAKL